MFAGLGLVCVTAAFIGLTFLPHPPSRNYTNLLSHASDWTIYGGSWSFMPFGVQNRTGDRGDKAIFGAERWTNYSVESDIRFDTDPSGMHWGDSGIVVRVTDPAVGVDAYYGYYVGISYADQQLFIGKANYGWNRLVSSPLPEAVHLSQWYHLTVRAKDCYIEAEVYPVGSSKVTKASFYDEGCKQKSGAVGIRTFGVRAAWKNFEIGPLR